MQKKILNQSETVVKDYESGQIKQSMKETSYSIKNDEPPFAKIYFDNIAMLSGISNSVILGNIISYIDYEGIVTINGRRLKTISQKSECSISSVNRVLREMIDSQIAIREGRGDYLINGKIFGKGDWTNIKTALDRFKDLQIQVTINKDGRSLDTIILNDIMKAN